MADQPWTYNNAVSVLGDVTETETAATAIASPPIITGAIMLSSINTYYKAPRRRAKPKALKKAVQVVKLDLRARRIKLED